jgi:hypothetical protein
MICIQLPIIYKPPKINEQMEISGVAQDNL